MGEEGIWRRVPWPVSPRTMTAKSACTARRAMMIMSSMVGGLGGSEVWKSR